MKIFDNILEFSFSVRLTPKRSFIAAVVASLLAFLTTQCGISEEKFLQFYNELRRRFNPANLPDKHRVLEEFDNELNRRIIGNEKLLEKRIKGDVDDAISRYERETGDDGRVRLPPPRFSERQPDASVCRSKECRELGGEMRLCSPWMPDCPPADDPKTGTGVLTDEVDSGTINKSLREEPKNDNLKFRL